MSDFLKDMPRWALIVLAVVGVGASATIITWSRADIQSAHEGVKAAADKNVDQDLQLERHEQRLNRHDADSLRTDSRLDRMDVKLDRILERVEK